MLVCHCKGKTCRDVRTATSCGAKNVHEVAKACEAGSECGGCIPVIEELLNAARARGKSDKTSSPRL